METKGEVERTLRLAPNTYPRMAGRDTLCIFIARKDCSSTSAVSLLLGRARIRLAAGGLSNGKATWIESI
jgi:hypothetical protein